MEKSTVLTVIKGVDQKGWAMVTLFSTTPNGILWRVTRQPPTHISGDMIRVTTSGTNPLKLQIILSEVRAQLNSINSLVRYFKMLLAVKSEKYINANSTDEFLNELENKVNNSYSCI